MPDTDEINTLRVSIPPVSYTHLNNIKFEKGVKEFSTDLKTKTVSITYDAEKTTVDKLKAGFKKFNYEAEFVKETRQEDKK